MAGLLAASPYLQAQDDDGDEVFTLSPFTIQASEESGYRATSTLAGTRLKTDLDDVGAAISVYTQELMEDLAATDSEFGARRLAGCRAGGRTGRARSAGLVG